MGFYMVALDFNATDGFFNYLGIGADYLDRENKSTFTLGANIDYVQEVFEGDPIRVTTQILDWDAKRLHYIHHMYHAEKGFLSAVNELLSIHVDMATRRSAPFGTATLAVIRPLAEAHMAMPAPDGAFRKLGIRRKAAG
jgi:acyl-CoA thioester hydrolase